MNILPQYKKDEIRKGYYTRILITSFWAAFLTLLLCSGLILPAYIMANSLRNELSERAAINSKATTGQIDLKNAPRIINQKASIALQNIKSVSVADKIIIITSAPNFGVIISKISYEKTKIIISGSAPNRDSLLSFEKEVDKIDYVKNTSVPVGDFAKEKDLLFSMTINIRN